MSPVRPPSFSSAAQRQRGSALITALLVSTVLGLGLAGYISLSRNALKLSQRTFYATSAANLAVAGLEKAVYSYRLADAGSALATAWSGWTLSQSNASLTLPTFNCGQNAIGVVKIYVSGYDGTTSNPSTMVQATVTPFDGSAPLKKSLKISLKYKSADEDEDDEEEKSKKGSKKKSKDGSKKKSKDDDDDDDDDSSSQVGTGWSVTAWYDLQGTAEAQTLGTLTGGFLN